MIIEGWHSDLAIPVGQLTDRLPTIVAQFPGARTLLFGYGKETFMTAPPGTFSKYFTGIFPGQAAIEVTALDTDLAAVYPPEEVITLALPPGGADRLAAFIRGDLVDDAGGQPQVIGEWDTPPTFVYAANSRYTFMHTCNAWAAQILADAGVPLSDSRVVTSDRLMIRVREAAATCRADN